MMMWVADLDIATPKPVHEAIIKRARHPAYGYPNFPKSAREAVRGWIKKCHGWDVDDEWLIFEPGVCGSVVVAIRALTSPGDRVLVLSPIYFPLTNIPNDNGRRAERSTLIWNEKERRFDIDWDDFEAKLALPRMKMLVFCNPHNPCGRSWTREELERIGNLCIKHNVIILSDEIHWDFVYGRKNEKGEEVKHVTFGNITKEISDRTIVLSAPSKTFNIPSLQFSFVICPNKEYRSAFMEEAHAAAMWMENVFGPPAVTAAYNECEQWVRDCDALYLKHNDMMIEQLESEDMKGLLQVVKADSTFLIGINMNPAIQYFHKKALEKKGLTETEETRSDPSLYPIPRSTDPMTGKPLIPWTIEKKEGETPIRKLYHRRDSHALSDFIFKHTGVYFNDGVGFGHDFDGWVRMNVGCPTKNVEETLRRIRKLITDLLAEYP